MTVGAGSRGDLQIAGSSNPEYVNARVRARRAVLFDEEDYRTMLRMGPAAIARFMEETEYEREIDRLGARFSGVDLIEFALNQNMARHFDDLLRWAEGKLYAQLAAYLRKFDAWNVKTVIRGIYSGTDPESIETDLIPAGEFHERFRDRLLDAESIEEVIELLESTIFGDALAAAYDDFQRTDVLVPLENAIDRTFYEHLLDDFDVAHVERDSPVGLYVEFLQAEIDFQNVRNALRIAQSGADIDPSAYFIEGGILFSDQELARLVTNREDLVGRIADSRYGEQLEAALEELEDATSLIQFEHAVETALLEYSDRLSHVYPTSVASVLSYILAKERERKNIRAIARGRAVGMDEDEIEEELLIL